MHIILNRLQINFEYVSHVDIQLNVPMAVESAGVDGDLLPIYLPREAIDSHRTKGRICYQDVEDRLKNEADVGAAVDQRVVLSICLPWRMIGTLPSHLFQLECC